MKALRSKALAALLTMSLAPCAIAQVQDPGADPTGKPGAGNGSSSGSGGSGSVQSGGARGGFGQFGGEGGGRGGAGFGGGGGARGGGGFGAGGGGGFGGGGARSGNGGAAGSSFRMNAADRPAIVVTQTMDSRTRNEWKDDLNIMDRLLRDQLQSTNPASFPEAMGIRLMSVATAPPMYIEGCGVVFGYTIMMPLAGVGPARGQDDRPANPSSIWERAKNEVHVGEGGGVSFSASSSPQEKFNQAKIDALIDNLVKAMMEAANIRHLADGDYVIVTIAGPDDTGSPVRLTLKARKSEIDAAASGKIRAAEFKDRVARSIG
ncbi:MAG TPA: hypothetical protein VH370_14265 [Humisphaera sp.]|jgi:hypothetical protein|nr:hypothetical protein [Humisphaera sp.]